MCAYVQLASKTNLNVKPPRAITCKTSLSEAKNNRNRHVPLAL